MKGKSSTRSAFFNLRALLGLTLCFLGLALAIPALRPAAELPTGHMPVPGAEPREDLARLKQYWHNRLTYPTGRFDPAWVREAAVQHARMPVGVPAGVPAMLNPQSPLALSPTGFTALGPRPERMTGCSQCENNSWGTAVGRVNDIAVDPTTTVNGSIVAYLATSGGGVWKTTDCCSASTTWSVVTDNQNPVIYTTAIDSLTIDPRNHNTIYAGTGGRSFAFEMGSQGILKSTNAGRTWSVLGPLRSPSPSEPSVDEPPPEVSGVSKVRVDPNDSQKVVAGTTQGLYFSYNGGTTWSGPCYTNNFCTATQEVTGLELSNMGGATRIIAAIGYSKAGANGANGIYKATMGSSGCPSFTSIANNCNGFIFGNQVPGSPYNTGAPMNAGSGASYPTPTPTATPTPTPTPIATPTATCSFSPTPTATCSFSPTVTPSPTCNPSGTPTVGNQLGRIDIAVAPSNPNYIYAQVSSMARNDNKGCNNNPACQLGAWATTDGGNTWRYMEGSQGGALRNCQNGDGDYGQNNADQGVAVDPNNPDRVFFDTYDVWSATRTGNTFFDLTCGFSYSGIYGSAGPVHVDQNALAFVPGSSRILLLGNDGGVHGTINADIVNQNMRPTWFNMYTGLNTIQFYSGDISSYFANAASPQATGRSQDNGASSVTFGGTPNGPVLWQEGLPSDGFYAHIDPVGTGRINGLRFWQGTLNGSLYRCVRNCTDPFAPWTGNVAGGGGNWSGDFIFFTLPYDLFHGGIQGGNNCDPAGIPGGCGHLIAGTTRVWETIKGGNNTVSSDDWYPTTNANMTKEDPENRSYINQVKYSPKFQSVAMVGTNDGNVWIGFNLGTGTQLGARWVDVTDDNVVLPNRPVLGIALDPSVSAANLPVGYAAIGGFNPRTTPTPPCPESVPLRGHVFQVTCTTSECGEFMWRDKTGDLPDIPAESIIVNLNIPKQVFVGTVWGVYFTDNITLSPPRWQRFENGIPKVLVSDMQIDLGATTLSAWTYGRGAYVYPLPRAPSPTPTPTPAGTPTPTPTSRPTPTPRPHSTATPRPEPT